MILMVPISYNVRSLFVRKTTTFATAFGIALVVFVLAAAMMLGAGIKNTLVNSGRPDNAIVLRKGSDNELSSSIETKTANLIQAAPGIKKDETGAPLTSGELVIVIALDKTGTDGQVSNVQMSVMPVPFLKVLALTRGAALSYSTLERPFSSLPVTTRRTGLMPSAMYSPQPAF